MFIKMVREPLSQYITANRIIAEFFICDLFRHFRRQFYFNQK